MGERETSLAQQKPGDSGRGSCYACATYSIALTKFWQKVNGTHIHCLASEEDHREGMVNAMPRGGSNTGRAKRKRATVTDETKGSIAGGRKGKKRKKSEKEQETKKRRRNQRRE